MAQEKDPPPTRGEDGGTAETQGGIAKVLKRIRNSFTFSKTTKAAKQSTLAAPGQVKGSRHLQSRTFSPESNLPGRGSPDSTHSVFEQKPNKPEAFTQPLPSSSVLLHNPCTADAATQTPRFQLSQRPSPPSPSLLQDNPIHSSEPANHGDHAFPAFSPAPPADSQEHSAPRLMESRPSSGPNFLLPPDRAEALFGKYGVPLEPEGYFYADHHKTAGASTSTERVVKPVLVRVHTHCHRCGLAIGKSGACINCGHKKCRKCGQWPVKDQTSDRLRPSSAGNSIKSKSDKLRSSSDSNGARSKDSKTRPSSEGNGSKIKGKDRDISSPDPSSRIETLDNWLAAGSRASTASSPGRRMSSYFFIPRIRTIRTVRRVCHRCQCPFIWTETSCQECEHEMCDLCPQDPPPELEGLCTHAISQGHYHESRSESLDQEQNEKRCSGSLELNPQKSRDRVLKKPRLRVRYNCEVCATLFEESVRLCRSCGHQRCENCPRFP